MNIGRQISKGTGVDYLMTDGTEAAKRRREKYRKKRDIDWFNNSPILALNDETKLESKMAALQLMLEFGAASQKVKAMKEIKKWFWGYWSGHTWERREGVIKITKH